MKISVLFIFASLGLLISACGNDTSKEGAISTDVINIPATASGKPTEPGSGPVMVFNEEKHDFGKVTQGEKVSHSFMFRNSGGSDLVISGAQGSCGCTVPSYPKTPIKPGEGAKIDIVFDSEGKSGLQQKTVTVVTNCNPNTKVLTVSATIDVPEEK